MNILLLSKDSDYKELALAHFENSQLNIITCETIPEATAIIESNEIKLVICDASLGSISIVQVAEIIHNIDSSILMVSLGSCFGDTNLGAFFASGIREFVCKKADLKLTEQRLLQLINNSDYDPMNKSNQSTLKSNAERIEINVDQNTIYHHSKVIHVTQLEFDLLLLFLNNKNCLLKREDIIENIWREKQDEANLRKVDSFVKKLRQKLNLKSIKSIRGQGYKWVE